MLSAFKRLQSIGTFELRNTNERTSRDSQKVTFLTDRRNWFLFENHDFIFFHCARATISARKSIPDESSVSLSHPSVRIVASL